MFRFYENKFPVIGDLVMVKVKAIDDIGIRVNLLEYSIEGMIHYNQLSRRKIRSIKRIVTIGATKVVEVISVDEEKGYVDLSLKSVREEEKELKESEWSKTKSIDSMLESASRRLKYPKEKIYEESIWPLYRQFDNENIFTIFEKLLENPALFQSENKEIKNDIIEQVNKKLSTKQEKYQVLINLTCFHHEEGIEMIKKALMIAVDKGFNASYYASPIYIISNKYKDEDKAKEELLAICEEIKEFISKNGGNMEIDKEPKIAKE